MIPEVTIQRHTIKDLSDIIDLDNRIFLPDYRISYQRYWAHLSDPNCSLVTIKRHKVLVGYVLYKFIQETIHLKRFCIEESYRRLGLGTLLLSSVKKWCDTKLIGEVAPTSIITEIPEYNLDAQLFLRANDFRAIRIIDTPKQKYYYFRYTPLN